jgi:hypothetical protein
MSRRDLAAFVAIEILIIAVLIFFNFSGLFIIKPFQVSNAVTPANARTAQAKTAK